MPDEEQKLLLPCTILGPPLFAAPDGYTVLRVMIEWHSRAAENISPADLPEDWIDLPFNVTVRVDYEIDLTRAGIFVFSGRIAEHKKYGMQFQADFCFPDEPVTAKMVTSYLDRLPHVGPARAKKIIELFGADNVAAIIENEPKRLLEISGITPKRLKKITETWKEDAVLRRVYYWLAENGVPLSKAAAIMKMFGIRAIQVLEENPYRLADIKGISFQQADVLAHQILDEVPVAYRVGKCAEFVLKKAGMDGHLCYPYGDLIRETSGTLASFKPEPRTREVLRDVVKDNFVIVKRGGINYIYRPGIFASEHFIAEAIADLCSYTSMYSVTDDDIAAAEEELLTSMGQEISLDPEQKAAIRSAFENKLTVITGGGGTGKSTICRCIQTIAQRKVLETNFLAPTGAAAKVLEEKTGSRAFTIHRRLGLQPSDDGGPPRVTPMRDNLIEASILVVDEFSMVGIDTLPALMGAIYNPERTNIVLVGDPQQLPSVSAGSFLADIIAAEVANVVKLNVIHRQTENSHIAKIADEIAHGKIPNIPKESDDFLWVDVTDDAEAATLAQMIVSDHLLEQKSLETLQVLSPKHAGPAGVSALNRMIQMMAVDMTQEPLVYKSKTFYIGDRVMQTVNNYDKDVYNGNVGYVREFWIGEPDDDFKVKMSVEMSGAGKTFPIEYADSDIDDLKLSWCATVHKYQGSQIEDIVMLMAPSQMHMMSRELVYTGMTRASRMLKVVGTKRALYRAVSTPEIKGRHTHAAILLRLATGRDAEDIRVLNLELAWQRRAAVSSA